MERNDAILLAKLGFYVHFGKDFGRTAQVSKLKGALLNEQVVEIVADLRQGVIGAIRHYRFVTGMPLVPAKAAVEQILTDEGLLRRDSQGYLVFSAGVSAI